MSPSGTGLRLVGKGEWPADARNKMPLPEHGDGAIIEVYTRDRYLTFTGRDAARAIRDISAELPWLRETYMAGAKTNGKANGKAQLALVRTADLPDGLTDDDRKLLDQLRGEKFLRLWKGDTSDYNDDASSADIALANYLAAPCGYDHILIRHLMRQSKLGRPKWDERRGVSTYLDDTIANAIAYIQADSNEDELDIAHTDVGLGERFAALYGNRFRYIPGKKAAQGEWFYYDGNRWQPCGETKVDQWIAKMGRTLIRESGEGADKTARERLWKLGSRALSTAGINAIRARIAANPTIIADAADFDRHPHLISVGNGVYNMRENKMTDADPALMLSRGTHVNYNPQAEAPVWAQTLFEIFGDQKRAEIYESDLGYTLTGERREHVVFFDYGPSSRNGKTLLQEVVKHIFGPRLCITSQPGTFLRGKHDDPKRTRNDVVRWKGGRMIQTSELPEGASLDEDLIKRMSGEDTITARGIYQDEEEFENTGKLWIRTNHFPTLDPDSHAIWSRVRLHAFEVSFAGRENKNLPAQLRAEAEGILARLIRHAHDYYQRGSLLPVNEDKVNELRTSNDLLGEILGRRFLRNPDGYALKDKTKELLTKEYEAAGEKTPTFNAGFDERMAKKGFPPGFKKLNSKSFRVYFGLEIRGETEPTENT